MDSQSRVTCSLTCYTITVCNWIPIKHKIALILQFTHFDVSSVWFYFRAFLLYSKLFADLFTHCWGSYKLYSLACLPNSLYICLLDMPLFCISLNTFPGLWKNLANSFTLMVLPVLFQIPSSKLLTQGSVFLHHCPSCPPFLCPFSVCSNSSKASCSLLYRAQPWSRPGIWCTSKRGRGKVTEL